MIYRFQCTNSDDLKECARLIDDGCIVVFPTDTVYGIGCDPTLNSSVLNLYQIKHRSLEKPLPILTDNIDHISREVEITEEAKILMNNFWPGQLTIVLKLKNSHTLSKYVYDNNTNSVAMRIPNNLCTISLIQMTKNKLLVGTSANLSNNRPVSNIEELSTSDLIGYDAILNGGSLSNFANVSTIIDITKINSPRIIREGVISSEKVFTVLNKSR